MADGFCGSKGGGSQHTPVEAPDSLRSNSYFRIDDGLAEGEIVGLVNGLQSVFLNGTPVVNADGTHNFSGVTVDFRAGTQDQEYIPGFSSVESDTGVATELRAGAPWTQALENLSLSAVRITLEVDGLMRTNTSNGDTTGHAVSYAIDVATDGGAFQTVLTSAFSGKTTSTYQRSHRVDLPKAAGSGWVVRVRRLTPNANSSTVADTTRVYSFTQIIDVKLRYPNYAHVGIRGDATQFNSIPSRAYECWGRIVRVPANYDPVTRGYTGVWDGTFKPAWTDNPAWVLYDIITNDRFGLGNVADPSLTDKWALYAIARYCDEMVDDGKGGTEPRYACNLYLQSREDAYKVLSDLTSIFHGLAYWGGGQIVTAADMPRDVAAVYTKANTLGGDGAPHFTYESTPRKTRYTCAQVTWNNPANQYQQEVEYYEDQEAIARYGVIETSFVAIGCTSQGQARREGKWAVDSSQSETDSVTFRVGLDSLESAPGDIIKVQDPDRAGARQGGRIKSATVTTVTLDKVPDSVAEGDKLTVVLPSGVVQQRTISGVADNVLTVSAAFDGVPVGQSVWLVETATLASQIFTVVSVVEDDSDAEIAFTISGVKHDPAKFGRIDTGNIIQPPPITRLPGTTQPPATNVTISATVVLTQGAATNVMTVAWDAAPGAVSYKVEWQKDSGQWAQVGVVTGTSVDVQNVYAGTYVARVTAIGPLATAAPALSMPTIVTGKTAPPPPPLLTAVGGQLEIAFAWTWPVGVNIEDTSYTELWVSETSAMEEGASQAAIAYPGSTYTLTGLLPQQQRYGWVRLVDKSGNVGSWSAYASAVGGNVDDLFQPIQDQADQLRDDVDATLAQVQVLQGQLGDIMQADVWDVDTTYPDGDLVQYGGKLYRSLQADNTGHEPAGATDAWWEYIGNYASLGEAVAATAANVAVNNNKITQAEDDIEAQSQSIAENAAAIAGKADASALMATNATVSQQGDDISAVASDVALLGAHNVDKSAFNLNSATVKIDGDQTLAQTLTGLQAADGALSGRVDDEESARISGDAANATAITAVSAIVDMSFVPIADPSFEGDPMIDWAAIAQPASVTWNGVPRTGSRAMRMVGGAGGATVAVESTAISHGFAGNETLKIGAWFRPTGSLPNGTVRFTVRCFDSAGSQISYGATSASSPKTGTGAYGYYEFDYQLPAGTEGVRVGIQAVGLTNAGTWSVDDVTVTRFGTGPVAQAAKITQALTANVGPSGAYAQATMMLDVNGRVTGVVQTNDGTQGDIVFVADKFAIVSPTGSGQRLEWSGGNLRVYDANNVLRVRMGVW